jgi:hypothetical protein
VETSTSEDVAVGDPRGVPIKDVVQMLGVPMPTLRSWELRYGIPTLGRGPGQHRRYLAEEVNALRLMRDEIARGQHATAAANTPPPRHSLRAGSWVVGRDRRWS